MARWPLSATEIERINRAKSKLNRRDPLNMVVDALLQNAEPPPGSGKIILHTLETRSKGAAREIAVWAAGLVPMSQEEAEAVNGKLIQILERRPQGAKTHCTVSCCCPLILPSLVLLPLWIYQDRSENRIRELAAVSLGRLGFGWNALPLCEAIRKSAEQGSSGARQVGYGAAYGLALVLRLMGPRAVGVLDEPTERVLGNMLRVPSTSGAWSVLEVLRHSGSSRSIRLVQQFLKRYADPNLVESAQKTLDALEARKLLETQKASLLRPSDAPADPGTLLRPYDSKQTAEEQLLLRPEEGSE